MENSNKELLKEERDALLRWMESADKLKECLKYMEGEEVDNLDKDFWNLEDAFWSLYNQCVKDQQIWYEFARGHKSTNETNKLKRG